jgi:hypothetical protein
MNWCNTLQFSRYLESIRFSLIDLTTSQAIGNIILYNRVTKILAFSHQSKKKFKSTIFESISNA